MAIKDFKKAKEYVDLQNEIINQNISYRSDWEKECKTVMNSYSGNKFPELVTKTSWWQTSLAKSKVDKPFVNLIKRQYRTTANYLLNNEPTYIITKADADATESDLIWKREFLNSVFNSNQEWQEDVLPFYDTIMDDIIFYWMFRWLAWTIAYFNTKKSIYEFSSYDSMDTYIDLDARSLRNIKKIIITYTKDKDFLRQKYPTDWFWKVIDWDQVNVDKKESTSDAKQAMLVDKPNSNNLIVREWFYLEYEEDKYNLYRVLTTQDKFLGVENLWLDFLPVTYFSPMNEPEKLYPRWWYVDMIELEREINLLIQKINKIVKTGGRFVYVREWTTLTKGTSNLLNSLDIEVIEVSQSQELPQQATLMSVSQADITHLQFLMQQAEEEWWMKQDIMWTSSLGSDASGRAIQALQAGSKNNIWPVLSEINKYMNRLVRIVLRLYDTYGSDMVISGQDGNIDVKKDRIWYTKVKVSITGRDAFDEVTKQIQSIQILDYITKLNPDIKISPETITKIFWMTNDIATDIQRDIDNEKNPDLQIAEGENKKLMEWIPMNANVNDDHEIHLALVTSLLKALDPWTPAGEVALNHARQHQAFLWAWMSAQPWPWWMIPQNTSMWRWSNSPMPWPNQWTPWNSWPQVKPK